MTKKPNSNEHLDTLSEIRSMMEQSSRFISLSGLSGVFAGSVALIGAALTFYFLSAWPFTGGKTYYSLVRGDIKWGLTFWEFALIVAGLVFILAIAGAIYFTSRKAKKKGLALWGPMSQRLLINLAIPLATGGVFILALMKYNLAGLVAPSTLIFYGLGLLNASKYTLHDIRYLGLAEIALGCFGLFNIGYGLEFWAIGFGVLHIVYGIVLYRKYER